MHEDPYEPLCEAELRSMASFYNNPTIRSVINDALYWRQRAEAAERLLPTPPPHDPELERRRAERAPLYIREGCDE